MPFLTSVAIALLLVPTIARPAAGQACHGVWGAVDSLTVSGGRPVYVEAPIPVALGAGTAMLGAPTFVWQTAAAFYDSASHAPMVNPDTLAGVVVDSSGTRLVGRPAGAAEMLAVRAVAARDSSLDAFWGAGSDSASVAAFGVRQLWHAHYDGAHWARREQLLEWPEIAWTSTDASVTSVGGEPLVAVPVSRTARGRAESAVALVARRDGTWRLTLIHSGPPAPTGVFAVGTGGGRALVVFSGADSSSGRVSANTVLVVGWDAASGVVRAPRTIADYGNAPILSLQGARSADGTLRLAWLVDSTRYLGPRLLVRAVSVDGGLRWTRAPAQVVAEDAQSLAIAPVGDRVLFVLRTLGDRRMSWALAGDADTVHFAPLPFDPAASLPRLAATGARRVELVWGTRRAGAYPAFPAIAAPALETAAFTMECHSMR